MVVAMAMIVVVVVGTVVVTRIPVLGLTPVMGMRMPPKHELLNDEEHAEPDDQRSANGMRPAGSYGLHRLREQPQQRSADQRARRKAHEMRQHPEARLLGQQQKKPRECGTRNAANRGEQDYPAEKGQGRSAFCYAKPDILTRASIRPARRQPGSGSIQINAAMRPH